MTTPLDRPRALDLMDVSNFDAAFTSRPPLDRQGTPVGTVALFEPFHSVEETIVQPLVL